MPRGDNDSGSAILESIANPQSVNLLDIYGGAAKTADEIWRTRAWQAKQAAGEAFQHSVNPDGTPNQTRLNQNLVAAGPGAALAALPTSTEGQALDENSWKQHMRRLTTGAAGALAILADNHGLAPQEAMKNYYDQAMRDGTITPAQRDQLESEFGPDPARNAQIVRQRAAQNLSMQQALEATRPGGTIADTGQGLQGVQVAPKLAAQPGVLTPVGPVVPTGYPSRADLLKQVGQPADERTAKLLGVPVGTLVEMPMVLRYQQQGAPATLTGPAGQPPANAPVPSKIPGNGVHNPRSVVTPAAAPAPSPDAAPAAPAAPAPDAAPTPGGMRPAVVGLPPGTADDVQTFTEDRKTLPAKQTTDQNLMHAYEALKLTTSGRSTESTHAMFNYLQAAGLLPQGATDELKNYELFKKYTERNIADLGNAAGTDQGRSLAAASNAGSSFSTAANMEIMRNDIAKNRQAMASYLAEKPDSGGIGYSARRADIASKTDYRGFAWNLYSDAERAKINKEVAGNPEKERALHRAIGMASKLLGG